MIDDSYSLLTTYWISLSFSFSVFHPSLLSPYHFRGEGTEMCQTCSNFSLYSTLKLIAYKGATEVIPGMCLYVLTLPILVCILMRCSCSLINKLVPLINRLFDEFPASYPFIKSIGHSSCTQQHHGHSSAKSVCL